MKFLIEKYHDLSIEQRYKLWEFILGIVLVVVLFYLTKVPVYADSNKENYKNENKEIIELEEFLKDYSIIPKEVREQMNNITINEAFELSKKQEKKINSVFEKEEFTISAYDLSVQSCGKKISSRGYGITRSGFDLRGHNWKTARVIATDPKVIPLGSIVYIQFVDENYFKYNGVFVSEDTGNAIKGYKIDMFFEDTGEEVSSEAMDFGVTKARIIILN